MAVKKERSVLLSIWLVLMLVGNSLAFLSYIFFSGFFGSIYPSVFSGVWPLLGVISLANVLFTIYLFKWKKWAFYGFCFSAVLAFVINLWVIPTSFSTYFGLVGPIILYLLMRSSWAQFE